MRKTRNYLKKQREIIEKNKDRILTLRFGTSMQYTDSKAFLSYPSIASLMSGLNHDVIKRFYDSEVKVNQGKNEHIDNKEVDPDLEDKQKKILAIKEALEFGCSSNYEFVTLETSSSLSVWM